MAAQAPTRRLRHARPDPRVRRIVLSDADYLLFEAIERHGPLPTNYLYEFTRHLRRDRTHLQNRLTEFYNGDQGGAYLTRPPQQFACYEARYQHLVYDLAQRGRSVLAQRSEAVPYRPVRSDPFVHRLMSACVSASFELAAQPLGLRYISAAEIFVRSRAAVPRSLALASRVAGMPALIPDVLFGYEYPGVGFRFFAVECDRNTESIERRNLHQSAFARKLTGYVAAFETEAYRARWGVPNLHVLTVTTSVIHAENILQFVRARIEPRHHAHFAIAVTPDFGAYWRVPKVAHVALATSPWRTPAGSKDISRP